MDEEAVATRYWCHMCSRTVLPLMDAEIKCPLCASGFVEGMADEEQQHSPDTNDQRPNNTSLWAPILMQLMNDSALPTSNQIVEDSQNENESVDSQLQEILRRRARRSVSVIQLLHGVRAGLTLEPESNGDDDGERGRVIIINPVPSSLVVGDSMVSAGSLSDYFIGPGFEALLQHLAENDPNRYGTPPAQKDAVVTLPSVKIQEASLQCSVCLDDFEIGMDAKEMPCKHKFHGDCLLPWLELHSSCPVCRYQLPSDETKMDSSARREANGEDGVSESSSTSSQGSENSNGSHHPEQEEEEEESNDGDGIEFSVPWLFSSLFSSSQGSSNPSTDTN